MELDYVYIAAWTINCGFWFWVGYTVRSKSGSARDGEVKP
jgi:hypothetical protein